MNRYLCGMKVNYITRKYGKGVWCYGEKGDFKLKNINKKSKNKYKPREHPTLVFLHGIGADKDMWQSIIKHIPSKFHCIMIDMPGHGETTFIEGVDQIKLDSFVTSIREFLEVTGLDQSKIILIGYLILIFKSYFYINLKLMNKP